MAIRKYKPTTPGLRGSSVADFAEITRSTPEKSLLRPLSKTGGRNNQGRITAFRKGMDDGKREIEDATAVRDVTPPSAGAHTTTTTTVAADGSTVTHIAPERDRV